MQVARLGPAHIASAVAIDAGRGVTQRFRFWLAAKSAARIAAPHVRGAVAIDVARPPVIRRSGRIVGKVGCVERRVQVLVIEDTEQFRRSRQSPVGVAARGHSGRVGYRRFPGRFTVVHLLPHQAGDVVSDRTVRIVRERLRVDRVVRILAKGRRGVLRLTGVRELHFAPSCHRVRGQAVTRCGAACACVAGRRYIGIGSRHHRPT